VKKRAVFLDRDGTINDDVGYPGCYGQAAVFPHSFDAVRKINLAGWLAVVVTNQSGVGRGYFTEDALREIHSRMTEDFAAHGARIDAIYYCPHYPLSSDPRYRRDCRCRKPRPGMGLRAARDLDIDLAGSYMVGDKVEDVAFGRAVGAVPVLVRTGYGRESERRLRAEGTPPAHVGADLLAAVDWILEDGRRGAKGRGGGERNG